MEDVEKGKLIQESVKHPENKELNGRVDRMTPLMTCEERLGHAVEVDRIKIYPNHKTVIEKTKRRNVGKNKGGTNDTENEWSSRAEE